MRRSIWKDYFAFSRKERIAMLILLTVIVIFIILPHLIRPQLQKPVVESLIQPVASENAGRLIDSDDNEPATFAPPVTEEEKRSETPLFYFDPNILDEAGWKKLGLNNNAIHTIIAYRNKGGHFYKPEDIRKIYGLKKEVADAMMPYIQIKTRRVPSTDQSKNREKKLLETAMPTQIDINTATMEDFKSLPGIGDVLSKRIIKFRAAIHGFRSVADIKKTYGLPDSTYQRILPYLTINDSAGQKN
jgi:DNA uptake protein ComE-like DNA-binding protein